MAVTEDFKQDVLEVLSEYTAQLENQTAQNATPIMPVADADRTVSMPAVKFDVDPRTSTRAVPQGYYQIPVSDFYDRIDQASDAVEGVVTEWQGADGQGGYRKQVQDSVAAADTATSRANTAATGAEVVNATLAGMTVTITDRSGNSRSTKIGFDIFRTYHSRAEMNADAANVGEGKFVMISTPSAPTDPDNATLWGRNAEPATAAAPFDLLSDLDQASSAAWSDWLDNKKPEIQSAIDQAASDHTRATGDHNTAASDHTQATSDHTQATTDHNTAVSDHTQATTDHTTAASDHTAAVADHTQAGNDHTQAGQDHTRAQNDHRLAGDDHTLAASDHQTAQLDHQTASGDHTQAGTDHTQAASDHTSAVSDHNTAATDHTNAVADHTQAGQDHSRAEDDHDLADDDHTQAGSDHGTAASDHTRATTDHNTAAADHTQAASDHTQAASDHTTASTDHTNITAAITAANNAASNANTKAAYANTQAEKAKNMNDHPAYIGTDNYWYMWSYDTQAYVKGSYAKGDDLDWDTMTEAEKEALARDVLAHLAFDDIPVEGSYNAVKSGGLYTEFAKKQDKLTFASAATCKSIVSELI